MTFDDPTHVTNSPGTRIGDFELRDQIVSDSMGDVYRAAGPNLPQDVAIRVLPITLSEAPIDQDRLRQDVRTVAALQNPHLAKIFALGRSHGQTFIVMELVEGCAVEAGLRDGQRHPERAVLQLALDITDGLAALHDVGLVHGNVKPANMVRGADGSVRLTNPSLLGPHRRNAMGGFLGTPLYIAPELIKGGAESPLCDIYSLGITIYYLLAGIPPFRGSETSEIFKEHLFAMVIPIGVRVPSLSLRTRELVGRMMRRDPKDRYPGCHELHQELQKACQALGPEPVAVRSDEGRGASPPVARVIPTATAAAAKPRHNRLARLLIALVAELLIVGVVALGVWYWESGPCEKGAPSQATYPVVPLRRIGTAIPTSASSGDDFHAGNFSAISVNFRRISPDWHNVTVGEDVSNGVTLWQNDRVTLIGDGSGMGENHDNCRYLYTTIATPYTLSLRVTRIAATHPRAMTGILTRDSLSPSAACVFFGFMGNGTIQLCCRRQAGGKLEVLRTELPRSAAWRPCYLRLDRYADRFRALVSADGTTWEEFGVCQTTIVFDCTVGLAVASQGREIMTSTECADIRLLSFPPSPR